MILFFLAFQFFLKRIAGANINACWTYHLCAKTAKPTKLSRVALGLYDHDSIAVKTGKAIGLLSNAARIKAKSIAARPKHLLLFKF